MQLRIEGAAEHKGFLLKEPAILEGSIIVLTGKNGSGKTRLIESLPNGGSTAYLDNTVVNKQDIRLVAHSSLTPNFGPNYNYANFQEKITASLHLYDKIKQDLDAPYDLNKAQQYSGDRGVKGLDYASLFKLCLSISKRLGKPASELTHDDITLHFEEPSRNVLGIQNMSTIVNRYVKRLHENQFNEWRCTADGDDVQYYSTNEFINQFRERPWIIANRILEDTFDGKFYFNIPDERSKSYSYQAQLIQTDNQQPVTVEHLSSGEKTLLWLALTLFNSQYYDADIVHTPKILLIDEPDAFLHPKMVLKMYKALESFKSNFNSIVIISTHSPTTVALAPNEEVYLVENNSVSVIEKDVAIAELLDGVTQISLNPKNRRQVFVESQYDAAVYQAIYPIIASNSKLIDPKISLNFVSSGPKMPANQLKDKAKQIFGVNDDRLLREFVESVNGVGNCIQVVGQVESLVQNDHETVRGIIDWDLKNNNPLKHISVLSKDYAYSIENITLDPLSILLLLHIDDPKKFTMEEICGLDISWKEWLKNDELLQDSIDRFIYKILGEENRKNAELSYMSGKKLLTDSAYLHMNGHKLEALVKEKYPKLNGFARTGRDGELKYSIVSRSMVNLTDGDLIPIAFETVLAEVQN